MFRSMYGSTDILASLERMNQKESESLFSPFHDYLGLINLIQISSTSSYIDSPTSDSSSTFDYPFLSLSERHRMDSVDSDAISDSSSSVGSRGDSEQMFDNIGTLPNEVIPGYVGGSPSVGEISAFNQTYAKTLALESIIAQNNMLNRLNHVCKEKNAKNTNKASVCVFCRNNGESREFYSSHTLKDNEGNTTCPILRAYTCPLCKANGDNSHTIKYCPKYTPKLKTDKLIGLAL